MSSVLGSTILVVPWAVALCGWALGVGVIIICGFITLLGATVLLECVQLLMKEGQIPGHNNSQQDSHHSAVTAMSPADVSFSAIASIVTPRLSQLPEVNEERSSVYYMIHTTSIVLLRLWLYITYTTSLI